MTMKSCSRVSERFWKSSKGGLCAARRARGGRPWPRAVDLRPDIVILDISMPELNGLEATRHIRQVVPAKILILTVHDSEQVVTQVLAAGAHGWVLKSDAGRKLVEAIRALLEDAGVLHRRCAGRLAIAPLYSNVTATTRRRERLTPREREVLQLLTEGRSNKEIGQLLGMATKTVETHRAHILTKLNLHSMSELVRYAIRNQIIEP